MAGTPKVESPGRSTRSPAVAAARDSTQYWTRERVIEALLAETERLGRTPSADSWRKATPATPATKTVRERFGTWNQALTAAGLPTRPAKRVGRWTSDQVLAALRADAARLGHPPAKSDWLTPTVDRPAASTAVHMFGSWSAAIRVAGMVPRSQGRMPNSWTPETVKQAIYAAAYKLRRIPTSQDMKRLSRFFPGEFPSVYAVIYHLGSWNEALIAVGYTPHRKTPRRCTQTCSDCGRRHWNFQSCPDHLEEAA